MSSGSGGNSSSVWVQWEASCQSLGCDTDPILQHHITTIANAVTAERVWTQQEAEPLQGSTRSSSSSDNSHTAVILLDGEQSRGWKMEAARLAAYCTGAAAVCSRLEETQHILADIDASYHTVSRKASELAALCDGLVREEQQLQHLWASLASRLAFFDQLQVIASKLNHPNLLQADEAYFIGLLHRVDACVQFLVQHPNTRDAETYLTKYRQLQTRALTVLKEHLLHAIATTAATIEAQHDAKSTYKGDGSESTHQHWSALGPRLRPLITLLEQRAQHRDYASALQSIYSAYFQHRKSLFNTTALAPLPNLSQSLEERLRLGCAQLIAQCELEASIFAQVFGSSTSGLRILMEALAAPFYDALRGDIVRSHSVDDLSLIISIVNLEYLERRVQPRADLFGALGPLFKRIVQDAQERLIFVAQSTIRDEISSNQSASVHNCHQELLHALSLPSEEPNGALKRLRSTGWHPSLSRTLHLLGQLHLVLDTPSFEGLAVEAVSACSHSLCVASSSLLKQTGRLESQLFLVRQLVILEQELVPLNVNLFVQERILDFTHIKNLILRVLSGEITLSSLASLTSSSALYSVLQSAAPRLTHSEKDIKKDLHALLTQAMDAVLLCITQSALEPLLAVLGRPKPTIGTDATHLASNISDSISSRLPQLLKLVCEYLAGLPVARRSILASVRSAVISAMDRFDALAAPVQLDRSALSCCETDA